MIDYEQQILDAQRRQQLAQGQSQYQAPQGRMAGRIYVAPNALEYAAALLRSSGAGRDAQMAGQEVRELSGQRQKAVADALRNFGQASQGQAPAQLAPEEQQAYSQMGDMSPTAGGVKPDMNAAYGFLMNAPDATLRQAGMQGMLAQATPKPRKMERVELPTPDGGRRVGFVDMNAENPLQTFVEAGTENAALQVGPGGQAYNPRALQPGQVLADPNKPFQIGPNGSIVPNAAFQGYETTKARASAPRVTVENRIENKAAENIAGQVGPILKESATAAEGAVRTLDAANRIIGAVDSGNIVAGPLANTRVTVRQAAQLLGIGGADNAEVLRNTRDVIRGLAEMTLQGRKQMSGQGAITESESKLAEKATSGDITDLTPAEIRQLANASRRASQFTIQSHQRRIEAANNLPGTQGLTPFFSSPQVPDGGALDFNALP